MKPIKLKRCKVCLVKYTPFNTMQQACSPICAIKLVQGKEAARVSKQHTKAKKELRDNDRSFQLKKTQQIFNKYIRLRDDALACVSCRRFHSGQYHAGHYRTIGANPELRFDPDNCHKQCSACNNHLSGNLVNYRINLITILGVGRVESLEGPHEPKRYTLEDLKEIQALYKLKIKELEK